MIGPLLEPLQSVRTRRFRSNNGVVYFEENLADGISESRDYLLNVLTVFKMCCYNHSVTAPRNHVKPLKSLSKLVAGARFERATFRL